LYAPGGGDALRALFPVLFFCGRLIDEDDVDSGTPVLCTTATATIKVADDITNQFGGDWTIQRGSLLRESLYLHNMKIPSKAARLAWLAENIPRLPGSGVVYVNSKPDADEIADWLRSRGITAMAYYAGVMPPNEV